MARALKGMVELYDTDEGCRSIPQVVEARAALAAMRDGADRGMVELVALPDIGPDPMKGDRSNRIEQATARVREAYVKQQAGVPDQTALVWRWDIGALLSEITHLTALAAMREGVDRGMVERESGFRAGYTHALGLARAGVPIKDFERDVGAYMADFVGHRP